MFSCAEKSLKAVLFHFSISVPRTHNLKILYDVLPEISKPKDWNPRIFGLTEYAVEMRYPGDFEEITTAEWREAIILAESVFRWAKEIIS